MRSLRQHAASGSRAPGDGAARCARQGRPLPGASQGCFNNAATRGMKGKTMDKAKVRQAADDFNLALRKALAEITVDQNLRLAKSGACSYDPRTGRLRVTITAIIEGGRTDEEDRYTMTRMGNWPQLGGTFKYRGIEYTVTGATSRGFITMRYTDAKGETHNVRLLREAFRTHIDRNTVPAPLPGEARP